MLMRVKSLNKVGEFLAFQFKPQQSTQILMVGQQLQEVPTMTMVPLVLLAFEDKLALFPIDVLEPAHRVDDVGADALGTPFAGDPDRYVANPDSLGDV